MASQVCGGASPKYLAHDISCLDATLLYALVEAEFPPGATCKDQFRMHAGIAPDSREESDAVGQFFDLHGVFESHFVRFLHHAGVAIEESLSAVFDDQRDVFCLWSVLSFVKVLSQTFVVKIVFATPFYAFTFYFIYIIR